MHAPASPSCPFAVSHQLNTELDNPESPTHLPGHPRVKLNDKGSLWSFLDQEFCSRELERMAPKLWWMSKQDGTNISTLHRQRVKKRTVIVTEEPKLHLVWIDDRIFVKPLPEYLLSHAFWETYLIGGSGGAGSSGAGAQRNGPGGGGSSNGNNVLLRERVRRSALGYLRTYFYLIKYESDFRLAQAPELCLIPSRVGWKQFCDFSENFGKIQDEDVAERYQFGEIRLTRLNFYAKVLLRKGYFHRLHSQYGSYFGRFYGPCLFVFGVLSVCLSAMQVEAAVEQTNGLGPPWPIFLGVSRWFSITCLYFIIGFMLAITSLWTYKVVKEWKYALRDRYSKPKACV